MQMIRDNYEPGLSASIVDVSEGSPRCAYISYVSAHPGFVCENPRAAFPGGDEYVVSLFSDSTDGSVEMCLGSAPGPDVLSPGEQFEIFGCETIGTVWDEDIAALTDTSFALDSESQEQSAPAIIGDAAPLQIQNGSWDTEATSGGPIDSNFDTIESAEMIPGNPSSETFHGPAYPGVFVTVIALILILAALAALDRKL